MDRARNLAQLRSPGTTYAAVTWVDRAGLAALREADLRHTPRLQSGRRDRVVHHALTWLRRLAARQVHLDEVAVANVDRSLEEPPRERSRSPRPDCHVARTDGTCLQNLHQSRDENPETQQKDPSQQRTTTCMSF